jgi:hypothetical protein
MASAEQIENAKLIVFYGQLRGESDETIAAAIATSLMESGLRNLGYGDSDSLGLFQQRPSQGWGTAEQIQDPMHSINKFFDAYNRSSGGSVLERIANTQRPAAQHRSKYANHFGSAADIFSQVSGRSVSLGGSSSSGSGSTYQGGSVATPELAPDASPEDIEKYIRSHYPDVAALLGNPELRNVMFESARLGEDATEVAARVRQTQYWQQNGPQSRAVDIMKASDPAAHQAAWYQMSAKIDSVMKQNNIPGMGSFDEWLNFVEGAMRGGWDDADIQRWAADTMRGNLTPESPFLGGDAAHTVQSLNELASQYHVPMNLMDLNDWALRITRGDATNEGFVQYVTSLAKSRFPWMTQLDSGMTVEQYFAPYKAEVANLLEMAPTEVDLFRDPKFSTIPDYIDSGGVQRARTLAETRQFIRNLPEFGRTNQYKQQDARLKGRLMTEFGAVA